LALCLKKHGCDPILFETRVRDALATEGAFITLAPNAMNGFAAGSGLGDWTGPFTRGSIGEKLALLASST
jgi:hypothetical protein